MRAWRLATTNTGVAAIVAGRIIQLWCFPEWSESEAFLNLWGVWLGGAILIFTGLMWPEEWRD